MFQKVKVAYLLAKRDNKVKQPTRGKVKQTKNSRKKSARSNTVRKRKVNQQYGTSQLERDFARDFLDKLGLKYIYQFEAKEIKRYYDFAITVYDDYPFKYEEKDGLKSIIQEGKEFLVSFLIEVDGDYFHSNPSVVDEKNLNPMQKHNKMVDKHKDEWAAMQGLPLLRLWESDIRKKPRKVLSELKKAVEQAKKKRLILENKKKPH
jgi:hypothetical protein